MGGEDRDLRFGMRRVLRDELLAQDDEEAEAYVHHGTEDAGDVGEAGGLLGGGERLAWSRAVPASAGRIVSHTLRTSGITACVETGDAFGKACCGLPGGAPSRGESGSRPCMAQARFRGFYTVMEHEVS